MYAHTCRYVCTYTYTYVRTHIYICIYTDTHVSLRLLSPRPAADAALSHTGERVVGGVLPRIGIGDGVCVIVYA